MHTATDLPLIDCGEVGGLPVLRAARALIDVVRFVDGPALAAALDSGLRDGLFTETSLHRRIVALRSRGR